MGATTDDAKELVDQIKDQQQVLAAAQARQASLMLKFSNTRRHLDHTRITNLRNEGADPRYTPGEFAALEIGLATKTNKHKISRTIGIARRLHDETLRCPVVPGQPDHYGGATGMGEIGVKKA